jgi:hypothetical protein
VLNTFTGFCRAKARQSLTPGGGLPKATAVFDADDSRLSGASARINGKMLALQSRIAKFAAAFIAIRAVAGVVTAGFDHLSLRRPCDERTAFVEARCRAVHSSRRSMLTTRDMALFFISAMTLGRLPLTSRSGGDTANTHRLKFADAAHLPLMFVMG